MTDIPADPFGDIPWPGSADDYGADDGATATPHDLIRSLPHEDMNGHDKAAVPDVSPAKSSLVPLLPSSWIALPPNREWIVREWIPRAVVSALYGDGGIGKSLLAQQALTCVATGHTLLGVQCMAGPALGLFCEDDPLELERRQYAINRALGVCPEELGLLRYLSRVGDDNALMSFNGMDIGQATEFFDQLDRLIGEIRPLLFVADTAADLFAGNENNRSQVRQFVQMALGRIARDHNCGLILCAHPSASGLKEGTGAGGSTAWNNTVRSRMYLQRPDNVDDLDTNARVLRHMKSNYSAQDKTIDMQWREGAFVLPDQMGVGVERTEADCIRMVFASIRERWAAGSPWSNKPQTRKDGRYLPQHMQREYGIKSERAVRLIGEWLRLGFLAIDVASAKAHVSGLKVLKDL